MAMKSSPDRCLLCDDPWTGTEAHRSRGLHPRCYQQMRDAGRLDEFPILRYAAYPRSRGRQKRAGQVVCLTPGCDDTVMRKDCERYDTYRCRRCDYAKERAGEYDQRLLPRGDFDLPLIERVHRWLDPNTRQLFRGVLTPFVKLGGPEGDCLIWQRSMTGNLQQIKSGNTYPQVHWGFRRQERVHRIVYSVLNNIPFEELLVVDHRCEIKQCINPAHLGAETLASNTAGRIRTRRHDRLWNDPDALRARLAELEQAA